MNSPQSEIELRDLVLILWGRRWLIILISGIFAALFIAVAFLKTPMYRATVVVVEAPSTRDGGGLGAALGSFGGLASLAGLSFGADRAGEEALAVLRSREFTERFITDLNLMPELFRDRWDPVAKSWVGERDSWPTLAQAAKYFDTRVRSVVRDKLTGLISLQIEWHDRERAAEWANELIARLNSEMRTRTIDHTTRTIRYLNQELANTSAIETRQAINRLMEAQINERMLASVTNEFAFRVVDKALPPDRRDIASPRKMLLVLLGPIVGSIFACVVVFFLAAMRPGGIRSKVINQS